MWTSWPKRYTVTVALFVGVFAAGVALGWLGRTIPAPNKVVRESGFTYIRPILVCNLDPQPQNEDTTLSGKLKSYVSKAQSKDVGVYYINPTAGTWAGYNQNESFSPASMLKVPIMVAVLRAAEEKPSLLSQSIYYDGSFDDNTLETIKPAKAIEPYHSYTVDQLLTYMVEYSDNNAAHLLHDVLPESQFDEVFTDLSIEAPTLNGPVDFMSPKTFTLFLRILYNSSYLSHELSEKALGLMAYPDFPQGLLAGVPSGTTVAQKFGEREINSPSGTIDELHNCGVTYTPGGPYLLCVMTRGSDPSVLTKEIADISKLVYDYVHE